MKISKRISFYALFLMQIIIASCSDNDYTSSIPRDSIAMMSIDVSRTDADDMAGVLETVLNIDDFADCGIDFTTRIYAFETADGNFGLCAKVADGSALSDYVDRKVAEKRWSPVTGQGGFKFTVIDRVWLAGYSGSALLVMGPVAAAGQSDMCRRMAKYLSQGEDASVVTTEMFERLDSMNAPVSLVARCHALPDDVAAPFMLGVPDDVDASQVMLSAEMQINDGCLYVSGDVFSFDSAIDAAISKASDMFRPVGDKYVNCMSSESVFGFFANVDGRAFLPSIQSSKSLQALLAGVNTVVDMDNILRSVDGNMSITIPKVSFKNMIPTFCAELSGAPWLADIDYWKQSCPPGSQITDWRHDAYKYTANGVTYYFGVTDDKQFYSGSTPELAERSAVQASSPLPLTVRQKIIGSKMAMVANLHRIIHDDTAHVRVSELVKSILGDVHTIVCSLN